MKKKQAVQYPDLSRVINDVNFLTDKSKEGDVVIYVGNNIGLWLGTVARMFPTLHFLVYDGNSMKLNRAMEQGKLPSNIHLKNSWFSVAEANK